MSGFNATEARRMADAANGYGDLLAGALARIEYEAARGAYEATVRRHPRSRTVSRQLVRAPRERGFKAKFYLNRWLSVRW